MYRFFDRDGKMLALRPDMTIPTARLVGSKLFDQPFPQRFFYSGQVFRYDEPRAGLQREFYQAGVELLGADGPEADAEILALAVESLRVLRLKGFRLVLGQMRFFRGLLQALDLNAQDEEMLRSALDRKSAPELLTLVKRWGIHGRLREALLQLPRLHGANGVLARAERLTLNEEMRAATTNLRAIERVLKSYRVISHVVLDLAEVRGMEYYTGITFEGFVPGLGVALLSGGRYNHLVEKFGPPRPAVGFAVTLDRALRAREAQGKARVRWAPDVVLGGCQTATILDEVQELRATGLSVSWHYLAHTAEELWAYARQMEIPYAVWCDGRETLLNEASEGTWHAAPDWHRRILAQRTASSQKEKGTADTTSEGEVR
jgi:ATP phosphoribosyltransferase, regulatory subunit